MQAEYWHDPIKEDVYRNHSVFLADINQERVSLRPHAQYCVFVFLPWEWGTGWWGLRASAVPGSTQYMKFCCYKAGLMRLGLCGEAGACLATCPSVRPLPCSASSAYAGRLGVSLGTHSCCLTWGKPCGIFSEKTDHKGHSPNVVWPRAWVRGLIKLCCSTYSRLI